jgi:PAS domain S-box-containing protein
MTRHRAHHVAVPFLAAVTLAAGLIAPATAAAYTWHFTHYTESTGAPSSAVMGLAQDDSGRVWFASRAGLLCYDGSSWKAEDDTGGLPTPWQRDVVIDHRGDMWSLTHSVPVRLCRRHEGRWTIMPATLGTELNTELAKLSAGRDADGNAALAVVAQRGPVHVWSREQWWSPPLPADSAMVCSATWRGSELLLATIGGLYRIPDPGRPGAPAPERVPGLPAGIVYAALLHPDTGALWVAGEGWFGELTATGFRPAPNAEELRVAEPAFGVDAAFDALGGLYVGTARTLIYLNPLSGLERVTPQQGLISAGTSDILVDREGNVWLANPRGVSKLPNRRLRSLSEPDGLLADEVSSVLQRRDGTMVLGHSGGLTFLDPATRRLPLLAPGYDWSRAMDLYEDPDGTLWIALDRSGLARLDHGGRLRWYGAAQGLPEPVYAIQRDRAGTLWVGTANGAAWMVGDRFECSDLREKPADRARTVRRLALLSDGTLLGATGQDGVVRLGGDRLDFWRAAADSGQSSVYALYEHAPGEVWVGTTGGLCRLDGRRLVPTTAPDPVIAEPIYAITPDAHGGVWFGTAAGVLAWNGSALRRFGVADGLAGAETNRDALTFDDRGRLWIGTNRGVSILDERLAGVRDVTIPLWITGLDVDGHWQAAADEAHVPAGARELIVRFSAPAFADEARLLFSTRLEGSDTDWSAPAPNPARAMRYTHLPPGRYRFHVRAIDVEGRRSDTASSATIVVPLPLHSRPWFVALEIIALAGVAWLVGSVVHGRRYARRLVGEVAARTSDLAHSEAAARAESLRQGAILASISDGVIALDAGGAIALANPAAATLLGRPLDDVLRRAGEDLLPGILARARDALATESARGASGGAPRLPFEYRLARPDGSALALECAAAPLVADGADAGLVLAFRDTTERRRAEQAAIRTQKLESLGVLAGGIAHDFNNLLTVIMGNASLLGISCTEPQRRPLEQIGNAAGRAQRLTAQLLTFARGGAPQKRLVDLRTLLREAAMLAVAGTNVSLGLDLAEDLWDADVDPGQIEQVISNLLINACQAMPDGGHVQVGAGNLAGVTAGDETGRRVEIRIRDEGCGIAPADLERIFEPYFTTKPDGTGLGLAISHSVIARHGGSLRVASQPGRGTEFTLVLPASHARARVATPPPRRAADGGRRVLVLDDEEPVRELLTAVLGQLGHEVVAVGDGRSALTAWLAAREAGQPFAAAIMDLTIPGGLGGREAMAQLRVMDPAARVIVASGYSQDPVLADHRAHGFVAKLTKPFNRDDVIRALQAALG